MREMRNKKREAVLDYPEKETRTMALPMGKKCGDCSSFLRCNRLIGIGADNEVCDFYPNRFHPNKGVK